MKWRARTAPKLVRRSWEGESVVFSPISGETHFLNAFSDEILATLETGPLAVEDVIERLVEIMPDDEADRVRDEVIGVMHRFDDIGLIEPWES